MGASRAADRAIKDMLIAQRNISRPRKTSHVDLDITLILSVLLSIFSLGSFIFSSYKVIKQPEVRILKGID